MAWQKKFYDFENLLEVYSLEIKLRAPNSWESSLYYLKQYVLDFFLNVKQSNNLNNWGLYFEEFRDWLMRVSTSKRSASTQLSFSSRNNIIGALNIFLDIMWKKGNCEQQPKCQKYPRHLLNRRDVSDYISEEEKTIILGNLDILDPNHITSDFFAVLNSTGMRLSEALGLSLADFFPCEIENKTIKGALFRHNLRSYGYLSLESQIKVANKPRGNNGRVARKPLKRRKRIDASASRIIPILDKSTFNILAKRYNEQLDEYQQNKYGTSKSDYLLFNGLDKNRFARLLKQVYEKSNFKHKSPHCCRHTFATNLAGLTHADTGLCRLVLGHRDEETTLGYVHLFEQINRQARSKELAKTKIDFLT